MENIKKQIISYLTKTSKHTFIKPKSKSYWDGMVITEYDFSETTYFKIFVDDENFTFLEDGKIRKIDIDFYIKYYGNNAKSVISDSLFLNKKMKSIRQNKYVKEEIEKLLDKI